MKKLFQTLLFAFSFLAVLSLATATTAKAAKEEEAKKVPEKMRVYYIGESDIDVTLDNYGDYIDNMKVDSKNAKIKITHIDKSISVNSSRDEMKNEQTISIYLKKYGTYKVSFDIMGEDGKKISTEKTTVYCYKAPFTIKVDNKNSREIDEFTAKTGKVTVTSDKKNPIKKLEYANNKEVKEEKEENKGYRITIEETYKKFKSGSKITFNVVPSGGDSVYDYSSEDGSYISKSQYAWSFFNVYTPIRVTYKDQYTGNVETYIDRSINKIVE